MWTDSKYKKDYDRARNATEEHLPPWFKLTPSQRQQVKKLINDYWKQCNGTNQTDQERQ